MNLSTVARNAYDLVESGQEEYSCWALAISELGNRSITKEERNNCKSVRRFEQLFREEGTLTSAWLFDMSLAAMYRSPTRAEEHTWRLGMLNYFIQVLEEEESRGNGVAP